MKALAMLALDAAESRGAAYADVRVVEYQEETLRVKNGVVEVLIETTDRGLGVRVISQGARGFASTPTLDNREQVAETAPLPVSSP